MSSKMSVCLLIFFSSFSQILTSNLHFAFAINDKKDSVRNSLYNISVNDNATELVKNESPTEKNQDAKGGQNLCKSAIKHRGMYGSISSPLYPKNYANNVSCLWGIRAPPNHLVAITIREFILEGGVQAEKKKMYDKKEVKCSFDFLSIFEQPAESESSSNQPDLLTLEKSLGTFCGYISPIELHSEIPGSRVYFYFRTDASKTARGFNLIYRIVSNDESLPFPRYAMMDDDFDDLVAKKEQEFLKVFSCIVFIFIFTTVLVATLYKCWKSTAEQIAVDGRAQHSCCCGAVQLDVIAGERGTIGGARRNSGRNPSPRLPTPPPEYGEVVKTEEDWNRVIQQLGEASATAIRQRQATEEVQVTYDLNGTSPPRPPSTVTSLTETSFINSVYERDEGPLAPLPASPARLLPRSHANRPSQQP